MKRIKKIGVLLLSIVMLGMLVPHQAFAASSSVRVTSASGNVGSQVTITCTASVSGTSIGGADVNLRYDATALQPTATSSGANASGGGVFYSGYASNEGATSLQFTVTFKILKQGTHAITFDSAEVFAWDNNISVGTPSKSGGAVTGKVPTSNNSNSNSNNNNNNNNNTTQNTKDSNSKLNSLQVYPGTLSPAFSADTTSYSVNVPADTSSVTISAAAQSSKAAVTVSGGTDLKLGENTAQVVVVAENGSSRAYTITIVCGEKEQISIGNINHTINENFTDDQIPTGFTRTKVTYNNRQYEGLTNASNTLQLLSLQNDAATNYYIYNQETQEFYTFVQIPIAEGKYIIPLPLSNEVKEFAKAETVSLNVQEKNFDAWKLDEEFSVVYAMNQDGAEVLYRYDSVDGVFQRYTDAAIEVDGENAKKTLFPNEYYMYAIVGLGSLVIILSIAMIYFIASRRHRHEGRKRRAIRKQEKLLAKEERQREKEERAAEKQRAIDEKAAAKQRAIDEKEAEKVVENYEEEQLIERKQGIVKWVIISVLTIAVICLIAVGIKERWNDSNPKNTGKTESSNENAKIEVDENLLTIELTIPSDFVGETTQEELDKDAKEEGFKSITLNDDGSATYIMSKGKHKEMMSEIAASIDSTLNEMVGSEDYPNITKVEANSDYTKFTVTTISTELSLNESFSVMNFYIQGGMYNAFNGTAVDNIHVDFVNANSGEIISSSDSSDMAE